MYVIQLKWVTMEEHHRSSHKTFWIHPPDHGTHSPSWPNSCWLIWPPARYSPTSHPVLQPRSPPCCSQITPHTSIILICLEPEPGFLFLFLLYLTNTNSLSRISVCYLLHETFWIILASSKNIVMGWIVTPPPQYISLESINITPFGKRVFANENKNLEMTSS